MRILRLLRILWINLDLKDNIYVNLTTDFHSANFNFRNN